MVGSLEKTIAQLERSCAAILQVASRRQRANHAQFRFPAEAMCYDCDGVSYTDGQSKISLTVRVGQPIFCL